MMSRIERFRQAEELRVSSEGPYRHHSAREPDRAAADFTIRNMAAAEAAAERVVDHIIAELSEISQSASEGEPTK